MALTHWYSNPEARTWRTSRRPSARAFHETLPGYAPTPLVSLPALAAELRVGHVLFKDESSRLGLPAFKILGASWAVCTALSQQFGLDVKTITMARLQAHIDSLAASERPVLVTATDGNHGRAVARIAAMLRLAARIYVPTGVSEAARAAIRGEGAELIETTRDYDGAVTQAARSTRARALDMLIQDTSWPGYTDIPQSIVDGYGTLFDEIDEALMQADLPGPDLVACPVGVGSFAHAMVDCYRSREGAPSLLGVEPDTAACVAESLLSRQPTRVQTGSTIMTGMNCGTPSELSWPTLAAGMDAAVSVSDDDCRRALVDLATLGQDAGPCGASTLAGVRKALATPGRRQALGVTKDSVVVLISTEGLRANPEGCPGGDTARVCSRSE